MKRERTEAETKRWSVQKTLKISEEKMSGRERKKREKSGTKSIQGMRSTRRGEIIKEQKKEEKWGVSARKSTHITVGLFSKCAKERA